MTTDDRTVAARLPAAVLDRTLEVEPVPARELIVRDSAAPLP